MNKNTTRVILAGILLLAFFMRFWQLHTVPNGLSPEQAENGEYALSILSQNIQSSFQYGIEHEGIFFFIQAAFLALFGVGVWQLYAASAVIGLLTVWMTYVAGARIFGIGVGLASAMFLATNPWHVTLSRSGFRAIMVPLCIAITIYLVARMIQASSLKSRYVFAVLAGGSLGIGWYVHAMWWSILLVAIVITILALIQGIMRRPRLLSFWEWVGPVFVSYVVAALTFAPMGYYVITHSTSYRFWESRIESSIHDSFFSIVIDTVLAFFVTGGGNPLYNPPGYPLLSIISSLLFALGFFITLIYSVQYIKRMVEKRRSGSGLWYVVLFALLTFMIAPVLAASTELPDGLLLVGTIPMVFWMVGIGGVFIMRKIREMFRPAPRRIIYTVGLVLVVVTLLLDIFVYFSMVSNSPAYVRAYREDLTAVSRYLMDLKHISSEPLPYLVLDEYSAQTVRYLTTNTEHPYRLVEPEVSHAVILDENERIIFTQSTISDFERYLYTYPESVIIHRTTDRFGNDEMIVVGAE